MKYKIGNTVISTFGKPGTLIYGNSDDSGDEHYGQLGIIIAVLAKRSNHPNCPVYLVLFGDDRIDIAEFNLVYPRSFFIRE